VRHHTPHEDREDTFLSDRSPLPLILCIDDDPITLELLKTTLERSGYEVVQAANGPEALESVRDRTPDLVLLDVMMPGMSGFDVCRRLAEPELCPDVPVVFQTASRDVEDKAQLIAAGAVDYLLKPIERDKLLEKVRAHLGVKDRWSRLWEWRDLSRTRVHRSEFTRFRDFLSAKFPNDVSAHVAIQDSTVASVYTLVDTLKVSERQIAEWIAEVLELPYVERVDPDSIRLAGLPVSFCRENAVLALEEPGAFLVSNPFDWQMIGSILDLKDPGDALKVYVSEPKNIARVFSTTLSGGSSSKRLETVQEILDSLKGGADGGERLVVAVNRIIEEAHAMGASDVHIEPTEHEIAVRVRIDGDLRELYHIQPLSLIRPLVSRLKIMCGLDISERRLPQDGRIVFRDFSDVAANFDLRVSTAPMQHGEKVVMRIVDKEKSVLPLSDLGFSPRNLEVYREKIRSPYGMILHVGPTGSGKSMTLYAALNEIQRPELNIQTAEDPIEYSIPGISQLQVHPGIGLTFGRALRCFLRQDPDIILLGEIRDIETAEIAVEASLTGHLLLSTLHTNDAPSAATRLIQMGIEPFMVSSSLELLCAQRLIRRVCPDCREQYRPKPGERRIVGYDDDDESALMWRAVGCEKCSGIGYRGRFGIHEILVPNDALRFEINRPGVTAEALRAIAMDDCGLTTLWWDAVEKARAGLTTLEEIIAKVRRDEFETTPNWLRSGSGETLARG